MICLVFDQRLWSEAEILNTYWEKDRQLADVKFIHDGRISRGHFVNGMRLVEL